MALVLFFLMPSAMAEDVVATGTKIDNTLTQSSYYTTPSSELDKYNVSDAGTINDNFSNNTGILIDNSASSSALWELGLSNGSSSSITSKVLIDAINADFTNNTSSNYLIINYASAKAYGQDNTSGRTVAVSVATAEIGKISGRFEGNYVYNASYGGIISNRASGLESWYYYDVVTASASAKIGNIVADFIDNYIAGATVKGGVIGNYCATTSFAGANINNITNSNFIGNYVQATSSAVGAVLYTNSSSGISITASNATSMFSGNYVQVGSGEKKYEAIYIDNSSATLTLKTTNNGILQFDDYINGKTGYNVKVTGDSTGTVKMYNDMTGADVTVENVTFDTADGKIHEYKVNSLTSNANVKYVIDVDVSTGTADKFTTATSSSGTVTIDSINFTFGSTQDIVDSGYTIQILDTQNSNLQLALSDALKSELSQYAFGQVVGHGRISENVQKDTQWNQVYCIYETDTIDTFGFGGLATTETTNDSIVLTVIKSEMVDGAEKVLVESFGDTLKLVNQAELDERNFNFDTSEDTYVLTEDLGATSSGTININGKYDEATGSRSTIDAKLNYSMFELSQNTTLNITNVEIKWAKQTNKNGVVVYNSGSNRTVNLVNVAFIGNYAVSLSSSSAISLCGGAILNSESATIESISGEFVENNIVSHVGAQGGAIWNHYATIGDIKADFTSNFVSSSGLAQGGAIGNNNYGKIGNISGDFNSNYAKGSTWVEGGAIWNSNMSTIASITGTFTGNYAGSSSAQNAQGGAVYNNYMSIIDLITADFIGNYAQGNTARGGAIFNNGATINKILNSNFYNNYAIGNAAKGGAIYTNNWLDIYTNNVNTEISGNYTKSGSTKTDNAIYVDNSTTLKFIVTLHGTMTIKDSTDGVQGHNVNLQGDATGTVKVYNNFNNANVITSSVKVDTQNNETFDYIYNTLSSNANTQWYLDVNTDDGYADNFTTSNASIGTVTIHGINAVGQNFGTEQKYQILHTQNSDLQLGLSEEILNATGSEYVIGRVEILDLIKVDTNWNDVYNRKITSTTYGTIVLTTTHTTNDSILLNVSRVDDTEYTESLGDTLKVVNQASLTIRNLNFDTANDKYVVIENVGKTGAGTFVINGVATRTEKSTIDFDGHAGLNVENVATVSVNNVKLINANSTTNGGVINSTKNGSKIIVNNADFNNNTTTATRGGVLQNAEQSNLTVVSSNFANNKLENSSTAQGGAIYNHYAKSEEINANFTNNAVLANVAQGAAIANNNYGDITVILGDFFGNYAQGTTWVEGGAIWNSNMSTIGTVTGNFKNNYVISTSDSGNAQGGAIYNNYYTTIDNIIANFTGNYAQGNVARGGAIFNNVADIKSITNSTFKNNYTKSTNGASLGGAIYTNSNIKIVADNGLSHFKGNYTYNNETKDDNAIYLDNGGATLTFEAKNNGVIQLDDNVRGVNGYSVDVTGDATGRVQLNNQLYSAKVNLRNITLQLGNEQNLSEASQVNLYSGTLSLQNNKIGKFYTPELRVHSTTNLALDVNLKNKTMDTISTDLFVINNGMKLNVNSLNITKTTTAKEVSVQFANQDMANYVAYTGASDVIYSPIYKYNASYNVNEEDGIGYFNFVRGSSSSASSYNPAVLTSGVTAQTGAQATQMQTFNYAFQHADMFMNLPQIDRIAMKNRNKYAMSEVSDVGVFSPLLTHDESAGYWFKPYATFENVPLKNGPKVQNISYGTLMGYDSPMESIRNGWDRVVTYYVGYNGSTQYYSGIDAYQNGGLAGATITLYKGYFFNATTISAGASVGESHNMYGTENFTSMLAGVGNKTGYNLEFFGGGFIIQPNLLLSYTFVKTFDYTNAAGVRIDSDPMHSIQIAPGVKFIGNTENGWQPYLAVNMVWDILAHSQVMANNVELPEMSIKPYVQYGIGLQRRFGDRFMAFGQAMVQNGGRNGVALSAGLRVALGKGSDDYATKSGIKEIKKPVLKNVPDEADLSKVKKIQKNLDKKKLEQKNSLKQIKSNKTDKSENLSKKQTIKQKISYKLEPTNLKVGR